MVYISTWEKFYENAVNLPDIFEDYNIVRYCFKTDSVNVMKNKQLFAKKQRKFQYILAWLSLSHNPRNCQLTSCSFPIQRVK